MEKKSQGENFFPRSLLGKSGLSLAGSLLRPKLALAVVPLHENILDSRKKEVKCNNKMHSHCNCDCAEKKFFLCYPTSLTVYVRASWLSVEEASENYRENFLCALNDDVFFLKTEHYVHR